ncbi:MAG: RNA-binding cell elongation regulator Jag/EloR [Clostridia bacterium]|nr:RNA-binding cell elongation regulator Jag/EloR [Clostridia bacterium]
MKRQVEQEAKTVEEAIRLGLAALGLEQEDVTIEILEKEQKGFLGFGSKLAKVRLTALEEERELGTPAQGAESGTEQLAISFLQKVFEKMNLTVQVSCEKKDHEIAINLSGEEMGAVIGRRGETLDALQYLTTLAVNRSSEEYYKISLDTENYRSEREKTLQNLALRLAEKAKRNRRNVSLEPMNAYERKIIHSALQNDEMIHTYSVGEEPNRKIIISPKNAVRRNDYHKRSNRPYQSKIAEQDHSE